MNADGYTTTGQGFLGHNMFAYCNNNPVCRADPTGELWGAIPVVVPLIISLILGGCSSKNDDAALARHKENLMDAPDLDINSAPAGTYTCLGNATGKETIDDLYGYNRGDSVENVFSDFVNLLGSNNVRRLNTINDPIEEDEYMVALKVCNNDFHFIRLTENGWYNKVGQEAGYYVPSDYVNGEIWAPIPQNYYGLPTAHTYTYTSDTIFIAVKVGWDEQ